jgi:hypothetical protein
MVFWGAATFAMRLIPFYGWPERKKSIVGNIRRVRIFHLDPGQSREQRREISR